MYTNTTAYIIGAIAMEVTAPYSTEILFAIAIVFSLIGLSYFITALKALKQARLVKSGFRLLLAVIFLPIALIAMTILTGIHGYNRLTHEELVASIQVSPISEQSFQAQLTFTDGRQSHFVLEGDEIQIDANIIKWKPIANILGLHTHYELSRISGRYHHLSDARRKPISAYDLGDQQLINLVSLRKQYDSFGYLLDAEYGSASFISANQPAQFQLYVSTSGLLIRKVFNKP